MGPDRAVSVMAERPPVAPPPQVDRQSDPRRHEALTELALGAVLVAMTALGGLWFAVWPGQGRVDGWLFDLVGASNSRWFVDVASFRYPWVIAIGALCCAAIALPTDRPRSLACLVGPPLALLIAEEVAKPLVGRTLGGALTYPSGSVVGAAALAMAVVLVTPARWRILSALLGGLYAVWVAVAVVALRWHFPTDALAGLCLGAGVVCAVDAVSWLVLGRWNRDRRPGHRGDQGPVGRWSSSVSSRR